MNDLAGKMKLVGPSKSRDLHGMPHPFGNRSRTGIGSSFWYRTGIGCDVLMRAAGDMREDVVFVASLFVAFSGLSMFDRLALEAFRRYADDKRSLLLHRFLCLSKVHLCRRVTHW